MIKKIIDRVGLRALHICEHTGHFVLFFLKALATLFTTRLHTKHVLAHMESIGVQSLIIVFLTGSFTGLALALQSYIGFNRLGAEEFVGLVVTLGMARELGPVLTGLMATGRCGSAMAAEIGTMRITEQIDALKTLRVNPFRYLIVPRIVASTLMLPFLSVFGMMCGIVSGYLYSVYALGINAESYIAIVQERIALSDITGGLIKAAFFGLFLSWVGTFEGYETRGGARGVGNATTRSVVAGSIIILVANYFLSSLLFQTGVA